MREVGGKRAAHSSPVAVEGLHEPPRKRLRGYLNAQLACGEAAISVFEENARREAKAFLRSMAGEREKPVQVLQMAPRPPLGGGLPMPPPLPVLSSLPMPPPPPHSIVAATHVAASALMPARDDRAAILGDALLALEGQMIGLFQPGGPVTANFFCSRETARHLSQIWQQACALSGEVAAAKNRSWRSSFCFSTRNAFISASAGHLPPSEVRMTWLQAASGLPDSWAGKLAQAAIKSLCRHERITDALEFMDYLSHTRHAEGSIPTLAHMLQAMGAEACHLTTVRIYSLLVRHTQGVLVPGAMSDLGRLISLQSNRLLAAQVQADWRAGRLSCEYNSRTLGTIKSVLAGSMRRA